MARRRAAFTIAENATDLHVGAGLGEREERRIKARLHARSKQRFHRVVERALQIAKGNVRVDRQAFHLMKDRRVRRVGRIVAMNLSRTHHAHRRLHLLHACESAPEKCACAAAGGRAAASIPARQ